MTSLAALTWRSSTSSSPPFPQVRVICTEPLRPSRFLQCTGNEITQVLSHAVVPGRLAALPVSVTMRKYDHAQFGRSTGL